MTEIDGLLKELEECPDLRARVEHVLNLLPTEVREDFLHDPGFTIAVDNYVPGQGSTVFMAMPGPTGDSSRSIVLKPLLADCNEDFAWYVIAHEFAHAFLRNGAWGEIADPEDAANALGANWGFPRPKETPWSRFRRRNV